MPEGRMKLSMQVVVAIVIAAVAATWAVTGWMSSETGDLAKKTDRADEILRKEFKSLMDLHAKSVHDKGVSKERFDEFMRRFDDLSVDVKDVQRRFGRIEAGIELLLQHEGVE